MTFVETALDSLVASIEAAQPGGAADYEKHLLNYLYGAPCILRGGRCATGLVWHGHCFSVRLWLS